MGDALDKAGVAKLWGKIKKYVNDNIPASITGNAATATKLRNTRHINGLGFDGSADRSSCASCTAPGSAAAKTVSITGFSLVEGAEVAVRFTNANTAKNPTLNVSGTGARAIYYKNAAVPADYIKAGTVLEMVFSGSCWHVAGELTQTQVDELKTRTANSALATLGAAKGLTAKYKYNGMMAAVYVAGNFSGTLAAWETFSLGTLPEAVRPPEKAYARAIDNFAFEILTNGVVQLRNSSNNSITLSSYGIEATITYLL